VASILLSPSVGSINGAYFPTLTLLYLKRIPITNTDLDLLVCSLPASFLEHSLLLYGGLSS
jgi:hypothetical protein